MYVIIAVKWLIGFSLSRIDQNCLCLMILNVNIMIINCNKIFLFL